MDSVAIKEHTLKCWKEFYSFVANGEKTFELRKNDRDFKRGETIKLNEFDQHKNMYTGQHCRLLITYVLKGPWGGLKEDWCILGFKLL